MAGKGAMRRFVPLCAQYKQAAFSKRNGVSFPDHDNELPNLSEPANTTHAKASCLCLRLQALSLVEIFFFLRIKFKTIPFCF